MAKVKLGGLALQVSGSIGGDTWSHNRYGTYTRRRAIPVTSTTSYALQQKARFSQASGAWKNLTDAQKAAWSAWAQTNPIIDTLGDPQILQGNVAYVQLNCRRLLDGQALLSVPPVSDTPAPLTTLGGTFDIGAGDFEITFTPTPVGATNLLFVRAAVVDSAGIEFVKNRLKLVTLSALNEASGFDIEAATAARFGALAVGQKVVVQAQVYERATALLSTPLRTSGIIVST